MDVVTAVVTRNGQISLPAPIRRRWGARSVLVIDCDDYVIVRPAPDSQDAALAELTGMYAGPGRSSAAARAQERREEQEAEARRSDRSAAP